MKDIFTLLNSIMMDAPDDGGADTDLDLELDDDEGIEIDLDDEDEPEDVSEDKPEDKPEDKKETKPEPKKEKMIPLSAFKKEKARLQKVIDDLRKEPGKETGKTVSKQSLVEAGFDEATAEAIASAYGKSNSTEKFVKGKFRDMEFKDLVKEFPDAEDNREELERYADERNLPIDEAYMAKYGKAKLKANRADLEREIEQRILDRMKKNGEQKFDTTDNGEIDTNKKKVQLTRDELQLAKLSGMTPQQYAAMKGAKSADKISKILNVKKG